MVEPLKKAWADRAKLEDALKEREKLKGEQSIRQTESAEIRESLKSLGRAHGAAEILKRYGERLDELDRSLIKLQNTLAEIELSIGEQQVRFKDATRGIRLDDPLPEAI